MAGSDAAWVPGWVAQFERMVKRDGGSLTFISVEGDEIQVGYRMGVDPACEDGVCVMPHLELQDLMNEAVARRAPDKRVVVRPLP